LFAEYSNVTATEESGSFASMALNRIK